MIDSPEESIEVSDEPHATANLIDGGGDEIAGNSAGTRDGSKDGFSKGYLASAGIKLDFDRLRQQDFTCVKQIEVELTNGMMIELKAELLGPLQKTEFHSFLKSFVNERTATILASMKDRQFPDKITRFERNVTKKRKNPSKFLQFCKEPFEFSVTSKVAAGENKEIPAEDNTPRKKKMKKEISTLRTSKRRLTGDNILLTEKLEESESKKRSLREEMSIVDDENSKLRKQIEEEEESLVSVENELKVSQDHSKALMKKIAGLKSGIARKKNVGGAESSMCEQVGSLISSSEIIVTNTHGICTKDVIIVENAIDPHIMEGKRYSGQSSCKSSSGHVNTYIEFRKSSKPCSAIGKREVERRAHLLNDVASHIGAGSNDDKRTLLTQLVKSNKELFSDVLKGAGFKLQQKMTGLESLQIQSLLRMSTFGFRNFRRALNNLRMNVLASECNMTKEKVEIVSHVSSDNVESGTMRLKKYQKDEDVVPCAFARVKSLEDFIVSVIEKDAAGFNHDEMFCGKWWVLLAGDKGGNHMKFHLEVVNSRKSGSVDNVHIYCLFEAADTYVNMVKVWKQFQPEIKKIMEPGFKLLGRELKIFLGGDYHFLDDMMGHQGSSSSYPCNLDTVSLFHLQNHGGYPHTPENPRCKVESRTVKHYEQYYSENLGDWRHGYNRHENGKEHYSVVEAMIFPLRDLSQVVPASLHIMLGVTLLLYNELLKVCRELDLGDDIAFTKEREVINNDWELASIELTEIEKNLQVHGVNVVTMINRLHRLEAILKNDHRKNRELAMIGDVRRKSKTKKKAEACNAMSGDVICCFVTDLDINVVLVQCDQCDKWMHTMCDGVTPMEEVILADHEYICLQCSADGDFSRCDIFEEKIASLLEEEENLNSKFVDALTKVDDLKAKHNEVIGERERMLVDSLEKMKVVRQAYHGNVMVGNHCVIVLQRYSELTEVIRDQPSFDKFNEVFKLFSRVMHLIMARRFLNDKEIAKLKTLCYEFGEVFPKRFPERNLTRKIHKLIFNVPKFVETHKTLGLLSEQEGESKHSSVNAELRSLASVRSHADKIRLVMEKEELRSSSDKSIIKPKPRLCERCLGRVFLRAGKDKVKHCQVCEPSFF